MERSTNTSENGAVGDSVGDSVGNSSEGAVDNSGDNSVGNSSARFSRRDVFLYAGILGLGVLTAFAWSIRPSVDMRPFVLEVQPTGIMGTSCSISASIPFSGREADVELVRTGLGKAEAALRQEEARLSNWIDDSEISVWNRTEEKSTLTVSPSLSWILHRAETAHRETDGAFDIYCGALLKLWSTAQNRQQFPTDEEIRQAKANRSEAQLGGIAKGFAIDQAMDALCQELGEPVVDSYGDSLPTGSGARNRLSFRRRGAAAVSDQPIGLLVDVGGDILVQGQPSANQNWTAKIVNPFSPHTIWGAFSLNPKDSPSGRWAVCTSGEYHRGYRIQNSWLSHIIDPRTGRPLERAAGSPVSVTVIAPTCTDADIWATALSVLGPEGIARLPENVQAYFIFGSPERPTETQTKQTPGFPNVRRVK